MLVDTGSAVTLIHFCVLEKAKIDIKLGMVSEPAQGSTLTLTRSPLEN